MKNYTITVNGNVYDVVVEEGASTGAAPVAAKAPAAPKAVPAAPKAAPAAAPKAAGAAGSGTRPLFTRIFTSARAKARRPISPASPITVSAM